jgi:hypothetical protein
MPPQSAWNAGADAEWMARVWHSTVKSGLSAASGARASPSISSSAMPERPES